MAFLLIMPFSSRDNNRTGGGNDDNSMTFDPVHQTGSAAGAADGEAGFFRIERHFMTIQSWEAI